MFKKNNRVEDGRVRAHETAEAATIKVHEIIDKVAEHTEQGSERAQQLRATATEQAAAARESAGARAAELREQAEDAKKQASKDASRRTKAARKEGRKTTKKARKKAAKAGKQAGHDVQELRDSLRDEVLPKVVETATGLAAAGAAAGRKAADEAAVRAPEVVAALREEDAHGALDAAKGKTPKKKKRRGLKLLLLGLVAGGIAAFVAKQKQGAKKDPWAVPAGDPYKAPTSGRESTVADTPPAGVTEVTDAAPAADASATAAPAGETPAEGSDAWSSARDWADNSSVPSTSETSEGADLATEHLGTDEGPGDTDKA